MIFATLLLAASVGSTAEADCFPNTFKAELIERSAKDQAARRAFIDGGMKPGEHKVSGTVAGVHGGGRGVTAGVAVRGFARGSMSRIPLQRKEN
jgi:hypothetical protein